ncbi:hypothetical protein KJ693_03345 [bacterium]|nr:hypothetical protein [bacterium]MBU1614327.1 hypothetical protein [bacterium]
MDKGREVYISGIGSFLPGEKIPFDRIEDVLGKITEAPKRVLKWTKRMQPIMKEMLGLDYYHYAIDPISRKPTESNVSMCVKSAVKALEMAEVRAPEIELIIYAGILMEQVCPPTTVLIQEELKIPHCAEIAIHSNCTSIYKALQVGADLVANGRYNNALIMTSQLSSPLLSVEHFNQKILERKQVLLRWFLCDGAGAMVITPQKEGSKFRVVDTYLESVGLGLGPDMYAETGGHRCHPLEVYEKGWHHLNQNFEKVAKIGPPLYKKGVDNMIEKTGLDMSLVKYFLLNIPTRHLMDLCMNSLKKTWPNLRFYTKLGESGYPGPPAIVIGLDEFLKETELEAGDLVVTCVTESSKWMHGGFTLEYCG